jgi:hypothetical protein
MSNAAPSSPVLAASAGGPPPGAGTRCRRRGAKEAEDNVVKGRPGRTSSSHSVRW